MMPTSSVPASAAEFYDVSTVCDRARGANPISRYPRCTRCRRPRATADSAHGRADHTVWRDRPRHGTRPSRPRASASKKHHARDPRMLV